MKCPVCHIELDKGTLGSNSESWIPENSVMATVNWLAKSPTFGQPKLWAYRCSQFRKVELTTEVKE